VTKFWNQSGPSSGVQFWSQGGTLSCGPDLRTEFNDLIRGVGGCEGIGQLMILRNLDKNNRAPGYDQLRGSSTSDSWDQGEIYQWSEKYVLGHFTKTFGRAIATGSSTHRLLEQGYFDHDKALIYLMHDSNPKAGDAIFRLDTNSEGNAYYPVRRLEKWRIVNVEDRRQERRKVAFYICVCERIEL